MVTDSATLMLFAIRSTVKLGRQARIAYVDSTRRREIVLPLSNFFNSSGYMDALGYFRDSKFGKPYVEGGSIDGQEYEGSEVLQNLLATPPDDLKKEDKKELETLHVKYVNIDRAREGRLSWEKGDDPIISTEEFEALFSISQWRSGADPTHSTLHRMAGAFLEIGIDYALNSPDLFDKNSKKGKAIHSFLSALDDIDLPETALSELPARFFVATMETVTENLELLSGDPKVHEFIKITTREISTNVAQRINSINIDDGLDAIAKREARFKIQDWGELLYRSTLSSGGRLILSDPAKFLSVQDAKNQALVSSVGNSILDLILEDGGGLEDVFSREGVEVVISAVLGTIGEHPEILTRTKNDGVKKLISGLAKELSQTENLLNRDIFPEIVRLVLEKSGENLELFWPELQNDPKKNLMVTAAKTTLVILSRKPKDNESWKPQFTKSDLLMVTEMVLDELVKNPGWLITEVGELNETLQDVLTTTIDVLREHGSKRLSSSVGVEIILEVLATVALRQEFTNKLPNGQMIVSAAIEVILSKIFSKHLDKKASWQLLKIEVVKGTMRLAMEKLALTSLDRGSISKLQECIDEQIAYITQGNLFSLESLADSLDKKFAVI